MIEREVKFLLSSADAMRSRLVSVGAVVRVPRSLEINWRYDQPGGVLQSQLQVLRLRKTVTDGVAHNRLTFKDRGVLEDGVRARLEHEVSVSDFNTTNSILQALGYELVFIYEKYRTTYDFEAVEVVLDETPLGTFLEIEGADPAAIASAADGLRLDWSRRSQSSYANLFVQVHERLGFTFRDMTFANLGPASVDLALDGLFPADLSQV